LGAEHRTLCIQQLQRAGHAVAVTQVGQAQAFGLGVGLGPLGVHLVGQRGATGQRVGHLAEGRLDGFFVLRQGNALRRPGRFERRLVAPGVKDRQQRLGCKRPAPGAVLEQARQRIARRTRAGGQADAREKGRARRANVGVGRDEGLLGLAHIGPLGQQVRRQPRRHLGQRGACGRGGF
jgi:hypothetical protein